MNKRAKTKERKKAISTEANLCQTRFLQKLWIVNPVPKIDELLNQVIDPSL